MVPNTAMAGGVHELLRKSGDQLLILGWHWVVVVFLADQETEAGT